MRKVSTKVLRPAAVIAATITAGISTASADFTFTLSSPTVSGGFDTYIAAVTNNGANGTGTTLLAAEGIVTMTSAGFIRVDTSHDITYSDAISQVSSDGTNDVNIPGVGLAYGSSAGTFINISPTPNAFISLPNGVNDTNYSWASNLNHAANPNFNTSKYSSLTSLDLVEALTPPTAPNDTAALPFMNIVVPHGSTFKIVANGGGNTGGPTLNSPVFPVVNLSTQSLAITGNTIAAGSGGTPTSPQGTFSTPGQTFTVAGGAGAYTAAFIHNITAGTNAANVQVSGFAAGDTEIFLLNLKTSGADPTLAQKNTIINDLNAHSNGLIASLVDPSLVSLGGVANPWDIELTYSSPSTPNGDFGFNFAGETNVPAVTVTDIAAVPEPASVGLLTVASLGLLQRRRNKKLGRSSRA